jgi:hypothetical protein
MSTPAAPDLPPAESVRPSPDAAEQPAGGTLSRRGFLRGAAIAGGGIAIATVAAACAPTGIATWTEKPRPGGLVPGTLAPSTPAPVALASSVPSATPSAAASMAPSASPAASAGAIPAGWTSHDVDARTRVRRYIGDLAPAFKDIYGPVAFAKLVEILGASEPYPELQQKPAFMSVGDQLVLSDLLKPLKPELDGNVKVFKLTIDEIEQKIDEILPPVAAFGYNKQWPGPTIRVTQGDRVRVLFTNNLNQTTGVHFHGVEFDDFFQDGIPFVTQLPITPGETYTYEFTARNAGSLMYHSHHNATEQVGRGLLGAFIVDPKANPVKYDREYVWISNDQIGGFTINGHGFPATVPVLAAVGETVLVRFMNEGIMMHPWHSHGYTMNAIARDGHPLGSAAFGCDTLGVNPGERWDVTIKADRPGIWAFHCHILPHVEGTDGMFGMVNTFIVVPKKSDVDAIVKALLS